jgi:hypothetical protein
LRTGVAVAALVAPAERRCRPSLDAAGEHGGKRGELVFVGKIEAARIDPRRSVDRARQDDRRMQRPMPRLRSVHSLDGPHRVLDQRLDRDVGIGDALTNDVLAPFSSRRRTGTRAASRACRPARRCGTAGRAGSATLPTTLS